MLFQFLKIDDRDDVWCITEIICIAIIKQHSMKTISSKIFAKKKIIPLYTSCIFPTVFYENTEAMISMFLFIFYVNIIIHVLTSKNNNNSYRIILSLNHHI